MLKKLASFVWAAIIYLILIFGLAAVETLVFGWLNYTPGKFARVLVVLINILLPWVMVVSLTRLTDHQSAE